MSPNEQPVVLPAADLVGFITRVFEAAGASNREAHAIADNLVGANLAGHDSHGIVRVPRYLKAAASGQIHFGRSPETLIDGGAFALLDGQFGFGQVLGIDAVRNGVERARAHGVSLIALRHAGHLGRIGHWAELACAEGFASIHFANVAKSMLVAPFGAAERRISTAPVAIGIPNPDGDDFLLDFATSRVAEGKVLVSLKGGKAPPPGSLIDADGRPTEDAEALYGPTPPGAVPDPRAGPGALVAMGDHKGSGLALACELLAGALTGSGTTGLGEGPYNGMMSIYLDPDRIDDGHGFAGAVGAYVDFVRSARPADPERPVMIPGDPERAARKSRTANGVPLPRATWDSLTEAARSVGLEPGAIPAPGIS